MADLNETLAQEHIDHETQLVLVNGQIWRHEPHGNWRLYEPKVDGTLIGIRVREKLKCLS